MVYLKSLGITLLLLVIIVLIVITLYAAYLLALGAFIVLVFWGLTRLFKQPAKR